MAHFSKLLSGDSCRLPIFLPRYYGGVILVGVGSFAMHMFLAMRVIKARKDFNFPCPNMYHPSSDEFNCIQRAHQNYLEVLPMFLMGLFVGGLYCPVGATLLGTTYLVGRIFYYKGYTSGVPSNRKKGVIGFVAFMALMAMSAVCGSAHLISSIREHLHAVFFVLEAPIAAPGCHLNASSCHYRPEPFGLAFNYPLVIQIAFAFLLT
ncbi:microsomal glutathione S transferase 3 [Echinococcus multilocularis]|uniref:Glutathione S-transferase 3, mitochondrial n=1 Tax=Echinococcus multilocularis TaxID=6211 RepID=A0A068Y9K2_ECHMU|nr:microsomal glutathione S transferase 3 [Echinococcus multilocularis]